MMGLTWILMVFLMGGDMLTGMIEAPPRDFASLIDPVPALRHMGQDTSEDALIEFIQIRPVERPDEARLKQAMEDLGHEEFDVRQKAAQTLRAAGPAARPFLKQAAKSRDPEVRLTAQNMLQELRQQEAATRRTDTSYAGKLLAVRALEKMESQKALPALKRLAATDDVTLAAAAVDAVAVIEGGRPVRPTGEETLQALARQLPKGAAVCALGEFVTGARDITLDQLVGNLGKEIENNNAFFTAIGTTADHMKASLEGMKGMGHTKLPELLAMTGNFRIDSVATVVPADCSDNPDYAWIAWVFRGLYDPERIGRLLESTMARPGTGDRPSYREIRGVPVYGRSWDPHIALVDKHTLAIVVGDVEDQERVAEPILSALTAEPNEELSPAVKDALAQFERADDVRIGFGGRQFMTVDMRAEGRRELPQILQRKLQNNNDDLDDKLEIEALRAVIAMLDLESAVGYMDTEGTVKLQATATAAEGATAMAMALKGFNDIFADTAKKLTEGAPEGTRDMWKDMKEGPAEVASDGRKVTLQTKLSDLMESISMLAFQQMNRQMGRMQEHRMQMAHPVEPMPAP